MCNRVELSAQEAVRQKFNQLHERVTDLSKVATLAEMRTDASSLGGPRLGGLGSPNASNWAGTRSTAQSGAGLQSSMAEADASHSLERQQRQERLRRLYSELSALG